MKYKDGVIIEVTRVLNGRLVKETAHEKIIEAIQAADALSKAIAGTEAVVTSVWDGYHSKNSLHYSGKAFDLRVWIYSEEQINAMVANLKPNLGNGYDVLFESDHIHVEYDPK
jgi:hypothetical protein